MCGFVVIHGESCPVDSAQLNIAAQALHHRGPDGRNIWLSSDKRVGMAFNRLALVGPRDEKQPFCDPDRQVYAVCNGEIYGYKAARTALEQLGARFTTRSDCELILHAYVQGGIDFVRQLNGEFAFVIWDERERTLFAARDRWGVKPLFFRVESGNTVLASEAKAILAMGVSAQWDAQSVFQHVFAAMGPRQTLFKDIRQLEPGHLLTIRAGRVESSEYWSIDYDADREAAASDKDALAEELRSALRAAVADRLHGDHPVASYLSGGVDSSAISAIATQCSGQPLDTFTVDFAHAGSEVEHASRVAAELGSRNHVLTLRETDFVGHFEDAVWQAETIGFNAIGVAKWMLSRFVGQHGYKAVLVGDGADELFGGYSFSVMDSVAGQSKSQAAYLQKMFALTSASLSHDIGMPLSAYPISASRFKDSRVPCLLTTWSYGRCIFRNLLAADFARQFERIDPFERFLEAIGERRLQRLTGMKKSLHLWHKSLFVSHILASERLDMAHSIESRFPYLDNRVVAVAEKVPDALLVAHGKEKYILREALRSIIPDWVRDRQKQPFQAPALSMSRNERFSRYMHDTLTGGAVRESGIFDQRAVTGLLERWRTLPEKTQERLDGAIMILLSFCAMQKRYGLTLG